MLLTIPSSARQSIHLTGNDGTKTHFARENPLPWCDDKNTHKHTNKPPSNDDRVVREPPPQQQIIFVAKFRPEVPFTMADTEDTVATVRKVKTAFLFYQADQLSKIRAELGLSMGDAMTHVSYSSGGVAGNRACRKSHSPPLLFSSLHDGAISRRKKSKSISIKKQPIANASTKSQRKPMHKLWRFKKRVDRLSKSKKEKTTRVVEQGRRLKK